MAASAKFPFAPLLPVIAFFAVSGISVSTSAEFSAEQLEFFEKQIRPVLAEKCHKCHSVDAEKLKGGLYLDSRAGLLKGGDNGPSVVPGDPEKSLLIELIHYLDPDMEMPPKSKLPDKVIADFEKWVKDGAAWPEESGPAVAQGNGFDLEKRKAEHWCWRPVERIPPAKVTDTTFPSDGPSGQIDQYILAKLESAGLKPAEPADRRTLIRRISFDLTGLPPTPEEVEAFVSDKVPDAFQKVVDRLLASPHFGERWGRHWLDLMRYAESHGHEFDYPIHHATQYRDYVIRAFNEDVPFDRLVTEHIAGDLLEDPRIRQDTQTNESLVGTGFWYLGEAVHAPTDVRGDEADRIDNMVDVFSKSFLGLTVSCARCHDHKFDAISTADYYALTGYLQSTRRHEAKLDPAGKIAESTAKIDAITQKGNQQLAAVKLPDPGGPEAPEGIEMILPTEERWFTSGDAFGGNMVPIHSWLPVQNSLTEIGQYNSARYGEKLHGVLRSHTFQLTGKPIHLYVKGDGVRVRLIIDGYFMEPFNGLLFGGTRRDIKTGGKWKWESLGGKDIMQKAGQTAYLEFTDDGNGSIAVAAALQADRAPAIESVATHVPLAEQFKKQTSVPELVSLSEEAKKISAEIPNPAMTVLSVVDGTPEDAFVHIRGSHKKLGEEVPRRFLTALGGDQNPAGASSSGRLELAAQVTAPDNPLTSRVAANRIWHHLFGRGIVPTVDDFGPMGIPPSHPELLDWLALKFVEGGWSQKELIRTIVLSSTYRMSATAHPDTSEKIADIDPDNVLLHKAPVRRLQAESIRDAMLAISGRLDPKLYGPSVDVHLTSFMQGRGRPKGGPLDGNGRRSIYTSIRRNFLPPMMLTFDMPSPFSTMGRRTVSNVPAQALTLMNDPFVIAESKRWAASTESMKDHGERIERMYVQAFSRAPESVEKNALLAFIEDHPSGPNSQEAWADLGHILWNKKEFIFVN